MKLKNAKEAPKLYFGMHFCPGVAQYAEEGAEPYCIFLNESTIKKMDPSFQGKPVYVRHVDEVNLEKLQEEADGYVVRSFYNEADGKQWCEFLVVSDRGHEAIRSGWRLSNAYIPKTFSGPGQWNGVDYVREVKSAEYEHLAIVPNPRYDESVIMTPEKFKEYNVSKKLELSRIANAKNTKQGEKKVGILNLFKKEKVENSADLEEMSVVLPQSKVEVTLKEAVKMADLAKVQNMHGYANGDHLVKVGEGEMSVNDLVSEHMKMSNKMKKNAEKAKAEKECMENAELDGGEKEADKQKKKADKTENEDSLDESDPAMENAEEDGGEKEAEKDAKKADPEKKKNAKDTEESEDGEEKVDHFKAIKNAEALAPRRDPFRVDLDKTARGKARYGSN